MMELPPFSGDNASCPKCGSKAIDLKWMPANSYMVFSSGSDRAPKEEHIQRSCATCRFFWLEKTLDAMPAEWPHTIQSGKPHDWESSGGDHSHKFGQK